MKNIKLRTIAVEALEVASAKRPGSSFRWTVVKNGRKLLGKLAAGVFIAASAIIQTALGQSTNGPILAVTKFAADQPAVLQWTSHTNEIYRIDYTADLTTNLTTAAENIPNQGTNTVWADTGTESSFYPRPSSADANVPQRFYRIFVQGFTSNDFPATITFSNVIQSAVLTGATNILASIATSSNVTSGSLLLDGNQVDFGSGSDYNFSLDTRLFPNGPHRLTVSVADDGENGTTSGADPVPDQSLDREEAFATKNVSVVFSNFLSDVHIKYQGYRPDLGQTQEVYGTWESPRNWRVDITPFGITNTIYRSFTGSGSQVFVQWNGLDSNGMELSPQRLNYVVYDLGASSMMMSLSSGGGLFAGSSASEAPTEPEVWVQPEDGSAAAVPLALYPPGMDLSGLVVVPPPPARPERTVSAASFAGASSGSGTFGPMDSGFTNDPVIVSGAHKLMGSFGMLYQGDHSIATVARPPRGPPFGQVTFATSVNPLWGKLKSVYKIADYVGSTFPLLGYTNNFIYGDDAFQAGALQQTGSNILNNVNLGLYVGHSAACKENLVALGHPQTYIPVYTKATGACTWVGMNDMNLGSSSLKWMAFYSCNLFRDSRYRANGCYGAMKSNNHLAMNSSLHIMQAYATEVTIRHDMGQFWLRALSDGTLSSSDSTVLGAWRYVCLQTQPVESSANANVSRSIYWEECASDHIYGYGSQTDPDPGHIQVELLEDDQVATSH